MKLLKYGILILLTALFAVVLVKMQPTEEDRFVAISATEEILELYNREALDDITGRLMAYPGFASSDQLESKRVFTRTMIGLLRQNAGSCQIGATEYQVIRRTHELRVDLVATCERLEVRMAVFWGTLYGQLVLVDLWVKEDTMKAIPEITKFLFEQLQQSRQGDRRGIR